MEMLHIYLWCWYIYISVLRNYLVFTFSTNYLMCRVSARV